MLSRTLARFRSPQRAVPARTCLHVESLEDRVIPSVTTVYVESNNPDLGENAVLAFHRNPADGSLTQIGTYATGGTGQLNLPKVLGPDDSDQEVVVTPDGRFLFAVNQGSNSITAFRIGLTGELERIDTFDSGGVQPVSLGISGDRLYVANRGDVTATQDGTVAPNYTGFFIQADGTLAPIPDSTVTFAVGTSPAQALISRTGRFLFADIFGIPGNPAPQSNTIAPFLIQRDGSLQHASGDDASAPADSPLLLGTASHPTLNLIYAGFTGANEIGVFTYDETGQLSFVDAVPDAGRAACWIVVSADGRFLYTATTGSDSIGVFSLADPLHPVQIQELALRQVTGDQGQTADFQIALDPSGQSLYVVNQSTNSTGTNHRGNQLHMLSVGTDGTLTEPTDPIVFSPADVPANAHPQGVAVVSTAGSSGSAAAGNPVLGGALAAFVQIPGIGQRGPLALELPGQGPLVLNPTAGTTARLAQVAATAGDGQQLSSSHVEVARLDAFFGSDPADGSSLGDNLSV